MPLDSRACPLANSWKASPISDVFCSWNRTISSFISLTIVSNLLDVSSPSALSCIPEKHNVSTCLGSSTTSQLEKKKLNTLTISYSRSASANFSDRVSLYLFLQWKGKRRILLQNRDSEILRKWLNKTIKRIAYFPVLDKTTNTCFDSLLHRLTG